MKQLHSFLMALCAATILSPAVASSFIEQQVDPAAAAHSRPAAKIPAVVDSEAAKPVVEKNPTPRKKLRPHSHPQDGKGKYVPDKK